MLRSQQQFESPRLISEGDLVVVYERHDCMKGIRVTATGSFSNKYGNFQLKDWIGQPYGSRLYARAPAKAWVYVLQPTPELWTSVLRHRTQILYVADISLAVALLELRPGSVVIESGTGSGSMTHSLARAVAPGGQVHTFEFHEERAKTAAREFDDNGLAGVVTTEHRDVEVAGFPDALAGTADALFLDLPAPWRVVPAAATALRANGVFCSFSPCIEQVQHTCKELNAHGFRAMRTCEILVRQYDVVRESLTSDMDPLLRPQPPPHKRGTKRERASNTSENGAMQHHEQRDEGRATVDGKGSGTGRAESEQQRGAAGEAPTSMEVEESKALPSSVQVQDSGPAAADGQAANGQAGAAADAGGTIQTSLPNQRRVLCKPVAEGRGHTGYLIFARKAVPI